MSKRKRSNSDYDSSDSDSSSDSEEQYELKDETTNDESGSKLTRVDGMKGGIYTNKQRVLVVASRGITARYRHLLEDFKKLIPHHKKDNKLDSKGDIQMINEIAGKFSFLFFMPCVCVVCICEF